MGQISLPVLNRTGCSMFWNNTWDNTHNFQQNIKEDMYINLVLQSFINYPITNKTKFFNEMNYEDFRNDSRGCGIIIDEYMHYSLDAVLDEQFAKKIPIYFSKVWILRFQNWLIVFVIFFRSSTNMTNLKTLELFLDLKKTDEITKNNLVFLESNYLIYNYIFFKKKC